VQKEKAGVSSHDHSDPIIHGESRGAFKFLFGEEDLDMPFELALFFRGKPGVKGNSRKERFPGLRERALGQARPPPPFEEAHLSWPKIRVSPSAKFPSLSSTEAKPWARAKGWAEIVPKIGSEAGFKCNPRARFTCPKVPRKTKDWSVRLNPRKLEKDWISQPLDENRKVKALATPMSLLREREELHVPLISMAQAGSAAKSNNAKTAQRIVTSTSI
jgi:hypothetical protein